MRMRMQFGKIAHTSLICSLSNIFCDGIFFEMPSECDDFGMESLWDRFLISSSSDDNPLSDSDVQDML